MHLRAILPTLLLLLVTRPILASEPCPCVPDLSGSWSGGRWESLADGHKGLLTATFERINATQYQAVFRGRFFRVIPFRFLATLDVVGSKGDRVLLAGSSQLPIFGTFSYSAEASEKEFTATYTAKSDNGVFLLHR